MQVVAHKKDKKKTKERKGKKRKRKRKIAPPYNTGKFLVLILQIRCLAPPVY